LQRSAGINSTTIGAKRGRGSRRIILHYLGLNAARSSGNATGNNDKHREATGNDLELISSDFQQSAGINSTTVGAKRGRGSRRIILHYLGLNAARSSGNAAGSNEKQREATRSNEKQRGTISNRLAAISSDLQGLTARLSGPNEGGGPDT